MKTIIILLLGLFIAYNLAAQAGEWTNQKKTQTKYKIKQIALLKLYASYASTGYTVVTNGLHTISDIKKGDLHLHSNYFLSLNKVSPKVKGYSKIAVILSMQLAITRRVHKGIQSFSSDTCFTITEINYINKVLTNLLNECSKLLDELTTIISDQELQMKDDERIAAIDRIYLDMEDKKLFAISFCKTAMALSIQRRNGKMGIIISKKLNGLK